MLLYSPLSCNDTNDGTGSPATAPRKMLRRDRVASDITLPVVDLNNDVEESRSSPTMTTSSSLTEHMFAELRLMDNMPASEWAPIGNSYTISSGQANKWNIKGEETDDKRKPKTLTGVYRKSKTVKLVLNL